MSSDASDDREALIQRFLRTYGLDSLSLDRIDHALTHRSWSNENQVSQDNERLEFLGDAVIASATSASLYEQFPDRNEGELSKMRAQIVSRTTLGKRALEMEIGSLLLLGKSEGKSGGRHRRSMLGSALEAIVGVLFLDLGYDVAADFVSRTIVDPSLDEAEDGLIGGDFKSELQEWTQARSGVTPTYRLVEESGPDHMKRFRVEVLIDGVSLAEGQGSRIKRAENDAARAALAKMKETEYSKDDSERADPPLSE